MAYFVTASASASISSSYVNNSGSLVSSSIDVTNTAVNLDFVFSVEKNNAVFPLFQSKEYKPTIKFNLQNDNILWYYNTTGSRDSDYNLIKQLNTNYDEKSSGSINTGSLLLTASVVSNTITFTKGNGSTFPITVDTGSGGGVVFPYTGSAIISGSLTITGSLLVSGSTVQTGNNTLIGNTVLSGSINVSGSQTFRGTNTLIGNTTISGSFTLSGSATNNIIGNTEVYGEFNVSGSSNFRNSVFIVTGSQFFTGSSFINGSQTITGNQTISGTLDVLGNVNVVSGSAFTRWGNKLFNYGQFSSTVTQSGSADTAYSMTFNTTDISNGVSLVSGSRITIENTGVYNIQFSSQLHTTANQAVDFSIWFAMTGSNIANSNTDFSIEKVAGGGFSVAALNFLTQITSGSYIELKYSKTTVEGQLQAKAIQATPTRPLTPSTIVTVTQVA